MISQKDLDRYFELDDEMYDLHIEKEYIHENLLEDIERVLKAICDALDIFPCLSFSDIFVCYIYEDFCKYGVNKYSSKINNLDNLVGYSEQFITSSCDYYGGFPVKFFTMSSFDIIKEIKSEKAGEDKKIKKILAKLNNEEVDILKGHFNDTA